jgi:hypothetical protein
VTNFLVGRSNRQVFLAFVAQGMRQGWDAAAQSHYRFNTVEELEQAWLQHLRETRRQPAVLAQNTRPGEPSSGGGQVLVRQTLPPAQPLQIAAAPVYRGVMPEPGQEGQQFQDASRNESAPASGYWQLNPTPPAQAGARLGAPRPDPHPPAQLGQPLATPWSPVGTPR